ncbi:hypothetical protein E2C01_056870 [Portunus trituberculatus]|uniref:Uncharacterized protein n=1 Tax=Portunus trituberculatus TaxID=210409 RepID=A0A5B7GRZ7_PORTR|nr:hypothetical protein [Portunus trituberculatus]
MGTCDTMAVNIIVSRNVGRGVACAASQPAHYQWKNGHSLEGNNTSGAFQGAEKQGNTKANAWNEDTETQVQVSWRSTGKKVKEEGKSEIYGRGKERKHGEETCRVDLNATVLRNARPSSSNPHRILKMFLPSCPMIAISTATS